MDETRIVVNQRLDLLDHTRLMAQLQEAFGDILGWLFGNPNHCTGAAADQQLRPLIVYNFNCTMGGGLNIDVDREWIAGGKDYNALVYDHSGERLTGPNSPTSQTYNIGAGGPTGTNRYLIARRVADDTTNETRQFYSAATGKTSSATDTRTIDSWELSEAWAETAVNSPASQQAVLANAGWVDIAVFQSSGAAVTSVTTNSPDILAYRPGVWSSSPPAIDVYPLNIGELIGLLQQVLERHRFGASGTTRNWYDDPTYDACFEEEGGIRFAGGVTATSGLQDSYIRLHNPTSNQILAHEKEYVNDANDLHMFRGRAIIAGNASSVGRPDTTNKSGFLYATNLYPSTYPTDLVEVDKYWCVDACGMLPSNNGGGPGLEPWGSAVGGTTDRIDWELLEQGTSYNYMEWSAKPNIASSGAGWFDSGLMFPINVPHECRLYAITIEGISAGMPAWMNIGCWIIRKDSPSSRVILNLGGAPSTANYGAGNFAHVENVTTTAASYTINNQNYQYYASIQIYASSSGGASANTFTISAATIRTKIREASHVY